MKLWNHTAEDIFSFSYYICIHYFLLTQTFRYRVISRYSYHIQKYHSNWYFGEWMYRWKQGGNFNYLIAPGFYYTQLLVWIFSITFVYRHSSVLAQYTFTVLFAHKQHAFVISIKVFVNVCCFKKWRSFICATGAPSFDKNNHHAMHTVSRSVILFQAEIRTTYQEVCFNLSIIIFYLSYS